MSTFFSSRSDDGRDGESPRPEIERKTRGTESFSETERIDFRSGCFWLEYKFLEDCNFQNLPPHFRKFCLPWFLTNIKLMFFGLWNWLLVKMWAIELMPKDCGEERLRYKWSPSNVLTLFTIEMDEDHKCVRRGSPYLKATPEWRCLRIPELSKD